MLDSPKGFEYWIEHKDMPDTIDPKAPEWAKKEFEEYQKLLEQSGKPDKNGIIKEY